MFRWQRCTSASLVQYNRRAPKDKRLAQLSINYMLEQTPKGEYGPPAAPQRLVFTNWNCVMRGAPIDPLPQPLAPAALIAVAGQAQQPTHQEQGAIAPGANQQLAVESQTTDDAADSSGNSEGSNGALDQPLGTGQSEGGSGTPATQQPNQPLTKSPLGKGVESPSTQEPEITEPASAIGASSDSEPMGTLGENQGAQVVPDDVMAMGTPDKVPGLLGADTEAMGFPEQAESSPGDIDVSDGNAGDIGVTVG